MTHLTRTLSTALLLALAQPALQAQKSYEMTAKEAADHAITHVATLRNLRIDRDLRE